MCHGYSVKDALLWLLYSPLLHATFCSNFVGQIRKCGQKSACVTCRDAHPHPSTTPWRKKEGSGLELARASRKLRTSTSQCPPITCNRGFQIQGREMPILSPHLAAKWHCMLELQCRPYKVGRFADCDILFAMRLITLCRQTFVQPRTRQEALPRALRTVIPNSYFWS